MRLLIYRGLGGQEYIIYKYIYIKQAVQTYFPEGWVDVKCSVLSASFHAVSSSYSRPSGGVCQRSTSNRSLGIGCRMAKKHASQCNTGCFSFRHYDTTRNASHGGCTHMVKCGRADAPIDMCFVRVDHSAPSSRGGYFVFAALSHIQFVLLALHHYSTWGENK